MNIKYLAFRILRHFMPEAAARFLLKRRWIIRPGLESSDPSAAGEPYIQTLSAYGKSIQGKRVLILGYGGCFAAGVELLRKGATHVVFCDHFVLLDEECNRDLLPDYSDYLITENNDANSRSEYVTLLHGDIRDDAAQKKLWKRMLSSTHPYTNI